MTNDQFNEYEMHKTVLALLKDETEIVTKYPAFEEYIPVYEISINRVQQLNMDYNKATKGLTKAKHDTLDAAYNVLVPVKAALNSIANKLSDQNLKAIVSLTDSKFKKLREEKFIEIGYEMVKAGKANIALLGGFKITGEKLDGLQAKLDELKLKKDIQGTGFNNRNSLWKALNKEMLKLHETVTIHLDAAAACTQEDDVDFYNKYKAARVIKDLGGSHGGNGGDTPPETPPEK